MCAFLCLTNIFKYLISSFHRQVRMMWSRTDWPLRCVMLLVLLDGVGVRVTCSPALSPPSSSGPSSSSSRAPLPLRGSSPPGLRVGWPAVVQHRQRPTPKFWMIKSFDFISVGLPSNLGIPYFSVTNLIPMDIVYWKHWSLLGDMPSTVLPL